MIDIDPFMARFCEAGARALARYSQISGKDPSTAPEYFMAALVMNELGEFKENGSQLALTLETPFSTLWERNSDAKRRGGDPISSDLVKLGEESGNPRVDMVIFQGGLGAPKDQYDFLALVEFKKGDIERGGDREKLLAVLKHIDTCPYGVACGWVESRNEYIEWQKGHADECNDRWYQAGVDPIQENDVRYLFCARLFKGDAPSSA